MIHVLLAPIAAAATPAPQIHTDVVNEGGACVKWSHALGSTATDLCQDRDKVGMYALEDVQEEMAKRAPSCAAAWLTPVANGPPVWPQATPDPSQLTAVRERLHEAECWPEVAWLPDVQCSAVLVAPLVVLTAGHCAEAAEVEFKLHTVSGWAPSLPTWKTDVLRVMRHPTEDLALMLLRDDPGLAPAPWVGAIGADWSDAALVGVGYGLHGRGDLEAGVKAETVLRRQDASLGYPDGAKAPCGPAEDREPTCHPRSEFVAVSLIEGQPLDGAPGDSGGAIYAQVPSGSAFQTRWLLVGIVSRGRADRDSVFGEGGVYVRPDAVSDWMFSTIDSLHRTWVRTEK